MFYTKITQLKFNNGKTLPINPNDIVIFVGPNNSGKSQSLRDIYKKVSDDLESIVIKDVNVQRGNLEELKQSLRETSKYTEATNSTYSGYDYTIYNSQFVVYNNTLKLSEAFRP